MPEVDTNIYSKLNSQQDPLEQVGKVVGIARGLNQNKLFNQQFDTNIALGEAYKNSTGPDGQIDQNKLTQNILKDKRAAWNLPEALKSVAAQKQAQVGLDTSKYELATKQMQTFREGLGSFLDQPNPKKSDLVDFVGNLISHKIITPQQAATEMADMPAEGPALTDWIRKHYVRALTNEQKMHAIFGQVQSVPTGGATNIARVKPMPRPGETGVEQVGSFPNTLQPGQETYNPKTRKQEKIVEGEPGRFVPAGQEQELSPESVAPKVASLDDVPGQRRTPAPMERGAQPKNQDRIPGTGRTAVAGPALGERAAAEKVGTGSGDQLSDDLRRASNFTREVFPLTQAIPALEKLGKTGTGPGTAELNNVKSFIQSLGLPGFDAEKIKKYDEANKYLTDFVNQNGNTGTNDKLAAAFAGNPSTKVSNAAAVDVAKAALALRRMQHAQTLAFQASGEPESHYTQWAAKWQNTQDPRAYGVDFMSPKAIKLLHDSLKGEERKKFNESYKLAKQLGIVNGSGK